MKRKRRQKRNRRYSPPALSYRVPARLSAASVVIDDTLTWYALWTQPGAERRAERRLRDANLATYLPSEAHLRRRRGGLYPVERPIGRYLFVGFDAADPYRWDIIRGVDEVSGMVTVRGSPLRVPPEAIQAFANGLARREVILSGGAFSRLMAVMAQADDVRARLRGPFWSEAA
jgi:transcription antitermination factor NusG